MNRLDAKIEPADGVPESAADESDLAAREAAYEKFIWDNLKRNYLGNYLHGMLGMTGFRLVNAPTFLPAYIHMISGSNLIVGLALALQQFGGVIAPIFAGSQVEHRTKVMPAAMWMGGLGRVAILCMALAGWFLKGQTLLVSMLFFIGMFGLFMGAQRVVFGLLMAKVIPTSRRGRLQAWRNATGGLIAAVGEVPVNRVVAQVGGAAHKPAGKGRVAVVADLLGRGLPVDFAGLFRPKGVRFLQGTAVKFLVAAHGLSPRGALHQYDPEDGLWWRNLRAADCRSGTFCPSRRRAVAYFTKPSMALNAGCSALRSHS